MKILRTIIILTLFFGCMAFTGCEESNTSNNQQEQTIPQSEEKPMDSKEKKQVMDSISVLTSQIKNLSKIQESNTKKLNEVSDLKGKKYLISFSLVMAAIALLATIITLVKLNSLQKRANRRRDEIEELERRISLLEQKSDNTLDSRIEKIEHQINELKKNLTQVHQNAVSTIPTQTPDIHQSNSNRSGYFELPSKISSTEAYFKRLSETRDSYSLFEVTVQDTQAEFSPIEGTKYLNEIKSNDDIKMALDIEGCAPSQATQMQVKSPGKAKKDGNRWKITKKATIVLY